MRTTSGFAYNGLKRPSVLDKAHDEQAFIKPRIKSQWWPPPWLAQRTTVAAANANRIVTVVL